MSYVYVHGNKHEEFGLVSRCVNKGTELLRNPNAEYTIGVNGQTGIPRSFGSARDRITYLVKNKPIGTVIVCRERVGTDVVDKVTFRRVSAHPKPVVGPGVEGVDRFEGFVRAQYPRARFAGDCVCKATTSGSHSDHADCAAVDYFADVDDMQAMRIEAFRDADYYHTKYVILLDTIYYPDGHGGWSSSPYSGDYHTHIHLSVNGGTYNSAC